MTDLTDAIDAFLAKYPDDAVLEWRDKPPRKPNALTVMVTDLVAAGERHRKLSGFVADTGRESTVSASPSAPRGGPPPRANPEPSPQTLPQPTTSEPESAR